MKDIVASQSRNKSAINKPTIKWLFLSYWVLCHSSIMLMAQTSTEKEPNKGETLNSKSKTTIHFSVPLEKLAKSSNADEIRWIEVENNKHLVLIFQAQGRKKRGHLLLLHTQGENPEHRRLIQPLTQQLVHLGWNLFIPSIADEDFPKWFPKKEKKTVEVLNAAEKTAKEPDQAIKSSTITQSETKKTVNRLSFYFKNASSYQDYFFSLCQAIYEQTKIQDLPIVIIANQHAAYWAIKCLEINQSPTPIVFLQPELPKGVDNNLTKMFIQQTSPLFSFHVRTNEADNFSKVFKKHLWKSNFQRFNTGMLSSTKLQQEDNSIAKTITGWVEKLK